MLLEGFIYFHAKTNCPLSFVFSPRYCWIERWSRGAKEHRWADTITGTGTALITGTETLIITGTEAVMITGIGTVLITRTMTVLITGTWVVLVTYTGTA